MSEKPTSEEPVDTNRRIVMLFLGACLVAGWALRVELATSDHGIYYPDELYQSLEQAHRLIFGFGITSWEFEAGVAGARPEK